MPASLLIDANQPIGCLSTDFCFIGAQSNSSGVLLAAVYIGGTEPPYAVLKELMRNAAAGYFSIVVEWVTSEGEQVQLVYRGDDDEAADKFIVDAVTQIDSSTV